VNSISMKLIAEGKELPNVIKADDEEDAAKAAEKKESKPTKESPILKSGK